MKLKVHHAIILVFHQARITVYPRRDVRTSHEIAFVDWLVVHSICHARLILPTLESVGWRPALAFVVLKYKRRLQRARL